MNKSKTVAFIGIMGALVFVAMFLESYVFSVLIPIAPPCFISISLAITISVYDDWKKMFIGGTILGVCSFFTAIIIGNAVFLLPWISILPRIFIGIVAFGVTTLMKKLVSKRTNKFLLNYLPYGVGAFFGVLTNTVCTLTMMYLCGHTDLEGILAVFMAINFPIELGCSMILVPLFVNAVHRANVRSKKD